MIKLKQVKYLVFFQHSKTVWTSVLNSDWNLIKNLLHKLAFGLLLNSVRHSLRYSIWDEIDD